MFGTHQKIRLDVLMRTVKHNGAMQGWEVINFYQYRLGSLNSNTVNSNFHLIQIFGQIIFTTPFSSYV